VSVGGGTNPTSVLKMIKKDNPDVAVILTDGYFCEAAEPIPACPVIWILVNNATESDIFKRPIDQVVKLTD
jgi:predicted metal-dependent peptidase